MLRKRLAALEDFLEERTEDKRLDLVETLATMLASVGIDPTEAYHEVRIRHRVPEDETTETRIRRITNAWDTDGTC